MSNEPDSSAEDDALYDPNFVPLSPTPQDHEDTGDDDEIDKEDEA